MFTITVNAGVQNLVILFPGEMHPMLCLLPPPGPIGYPSRRCSGAQDPHWRFNNIRAGYVISQVLVLAVYYTFFGPQDRRNCIEIRYFPLRPSAVLKCGTSPLRSSACTSDLQSV